MSDVIGFADFVQNRLLNSPHGLGARPQHQQTGFTRRDCEDLEDWSSAEHRVSVCSTDMGVFAMVHQAGRPWASWGVVRQGRSVLLWDCVTLADIGAFPSMIDALAAVPIDQFPTPVENIVQFAPAPARTARMGSI